MSGIFSGMSIALILFLSVLAFFWILAPLYIYMIKNRMDTLINETRETRYAIMRLTVQIEKLNKPDKI